MAPLWKLYQMTLTYFFKVETLKCYYLGNRPCAKIRNYFKYHVSSKMQMITMLLLQICLHLYGTRRRVSLVDFLPWRQLFINFQREQSCNNNYCFYSHLCFPLSQKMKLFSTLHKSIDHWFLDRLSIRPPAYISKDNRCKDGLQFRFIIISSFEPLYYGPKLP